MTIDAIRSALLWCTAINYVLLVLWFLLFTVAHRWLNGIWGRWFRLSVEQFDALNCGGIVLYKTGILLFNLVPYLALRIVA